MYHLEQNSRKHAPSFCEKLNNTVHQNLLRQSVLSWRPTFWKLSLSIIRVSVGSDHILLICALVFQCDASFCWCNKWQEDGVKLCGHPANSGHFTVSLDLGPLFVNQFLSLVVWRIPPDICSNICCLSCCCQKRHNNVVVGFCALLNFNCSSLNSIQV